MSDYAELHAISNFTFLRGASHPEELVRTAVELGYKALAITDECSVSGIVRAHMAAKESHLKLIVGSEFLLDTGLKLVVLARNRDGYAELCQLITRARALPKKVSTASPPPISRPGLAIAWRCGFPTTGFSWALKTAGCSMHSAIVCGSPSNCLPTAWSGNGLLVPAASEKPWDCRWLLPAMYTCIAGSGVRCRTRSRPYAKN